MKCPKCKSQNFNEIIDGCSVIRNFTSDKKTTTLLNQEIITDDAQNYLECDNCKENLDKLFNQFMKEYK